MTYPPQRNRIVETRREQMFPHLNDTQLLDLLPFGEHRSYAAGDVLFTEGDRHVPMIVVLSGAVDIIRHTREGELLVTTHTPGSFSGEVGVLAGRGSIASARARENSRVLIIAEAALHRLVVTHADLSEVIMRAFILRRVALLDERAGVTLIGSRLAPHTHQLRQFLERNAQPHIYLDLDDDADTAAVMALHHITADELPVAITVCGQVLKHPSIRELADAVALTPDRLDGREVDVCVIGAGPAGLAAAVYAASEGLSVVVVDAKAPGGQAGSSSKIENYFGFPTGISGQALAGRGFVQAQKFGAEVAIPRKAVDFECSQGKDTIVILDGGERLTARSVVLATGARYRKLDTVANLEQFEGRGVYYAAGMMEAKLCYGQEVVVVGGGNSAGQAAVFLASHVRHVHVLVRSKSLAASMSTYLIRRIEASPNITLRTETEVVGMVGDRSLDSVVLRHHGTGRDEPRKIQHVFLFCGAEPHTAWLSECIALDAKQFILTGADISPEELRDKEWPLARPPMRLETTHPGVFAVGDVRSGSVKRVAAAVGEGSTAVQLLHAYLAEHAAATGAAQ